MRASTWVGLLLLGLIAAVVPVSVADARSPVAKGPEVVVTGKGYDIVANNPEKAEKMAVDIAHEKLLEELTRRFGESDWKVSTEELHRRGLIEVVDAGTEDVFQDQPPLVVKEAKIKLPHDFLQELGDQARGERKYGRQMVLARVLIGAVVLLLTIAGYLRVEEATKGYYTWMLRAAVVGVLVATGAALWMS
jgi:hypothetical protein